MLVAVVLMFLILVVVLPIVVNYLWNLVILGLVFNVFNIKIKEKKFFLYILVLTLAGLVIDIVTLVMHYVLGLGFFEWTITVGILLFLLSFSLTRLFYRLSRQKCIVSGLVYGTLSHPVIGIMLILPLLEGITPVPSYYLNIGLAILRLILC